MLLDVDKLRETMVSKGLTVKKLAKASGVSACAIGLWLNRGAQPRMDTLGRILKVLDVPTREIVKEW
jgi:transcriptional regulator with XRE-family HTH domain